MTNARPGDAARPDRRVPRRRRGHPDRDGSGPGAPGARTSRRRSCPSFFYTSDWGLPVLAGVVGLLVLLAVAFALAAPKGTWLKGRLEPHVASHKRQVVKRERESRKMALFAPLFKATESVFGKFRHVEEARPDPPAGRPAAEDRRVRLHHAGGRPRRRASSRRSSSRPCLGYRARRRRRRRPSPTSSCCTRPRSA